jgi:hypothetical protein
VSKDKQMIQLEQGRELTCDNPPQNILFHHHPKLQKREEKAVSLSEHQKSKEINLTNDEN